MRKIIKYILYGLYWFGRFDVDLYLKKGPSSKVGIIQF